jgi:hypothetical protein
MHRLMPTGKRRSAGLRYQNKPSSTLGIFKPACA